MVSPVILYVVEIAKGSKTKIQLCEQALMLVWPGSYSPVQVLLKNTDGVNFLLRTLAFCHAQKVKVRKHEQKLCPNLNGLQQADFVCFTKLQMSFILPSCLGLRRLSQVGVRLFETHAC
jgi:hypothetical protein